DVHGSGGRGGQTMRTAALAEAPSAIRSGGGRGEEILEPVTHRGVKSTLTIRGERSTGDDELVIAAFDQFEAMYPGWMPEDVEVEFTWAVVPDNARAMAFVAPFDAPNKVVVHQTEWSDNASNLEWLHKKSSHASTGVRAFWLALIAEGGNEDDALDTFLRATIFHELAHTGAAVRGWAFEWPEDI